MISSLNNSMDRAIKLIKEAKTIYLASHVQPDGDNIGSTLALSLALKQFKDDIRVLKVDEIPSDYKFLPGIELIRDYEIDNNIDVFIALDCSDMDRLGIGKEFAKNAQYIINIDHHITNTNFGHVNLVSPSSAATGELVYSLLKQMRVEIDRDIASCLYTALSTDTGSFMFSNTSHLTHKIAGNLLETGIDISYINRKLYQSSSLEKTKLLVEAIDRMELHLEGKVGVVVISQELLRETNTKLEDTEGIISFVRNIDSIELACLLKEINPDETKVSMRSKEYIDVAKVCINLKGGGHKRAAGCSINKGINEAKAIILKEIERAFW